jgi:hypothetical protein
MRADAINQQPNQRAQLCGDFIFIWRAETGCDPSRPSIAATNEQETIHLALFINDNR